MALLQLSYGLGRDANSDGDGLQNIGQILAAKFKSLHIEITTVPHNLDPPIGVVSKPFWFAGQSAGAGAAEGYALGAGVPIDFMVLAVTYPFFQDGQFIAQSYKQPSFVKELWAYRLDAGLLPGMPLIAGHNYREIVLPPIPGQQGLDPHMGVFKRQSVIDELMAKFDQLAKQDGVT